METKSIDLLNQKLKNVPQVFLERIIEYVDSLLEPANTSYTLSKQEQQLLDSQINSDKALYTDADTLYIDLKKKYEL